MVRHVLLGTAAATAILAASAARAASPHAYTIRFQAMVGALPFHCGQTYSGIGRARASVTPEYLRFYVSQVRLIDRAGKRVPLALHQDGTWQQRDVAFLSFEEPRSNCANGSPQHHTSIDGTAPAGAYDGIEFTLGVPEDLDHADATIAQSPLNLSDMFWSWQDGYKFFRFDTRVGDGSRSASYIFHLGSTDCTMQGRTAHCAGPNRVTVTLRPFNPAKNVVAADIASLLRNADLARLARGGGCMSGPSDACQPVMRDLGVAFRGQAASPQKLFFVK